MQKRESAPLVAIACGGTGGHLFPGLAVGEELFQRGCDVTLLISPKEVDQQAVRAASGMRIATLPAVGLVRGNLAGFLKGFYVSYRAAKQLFAERAPKAVLAMGGFTSAPPVLAARKFRAATFLHESNTIPGRANRFLARFVTQAFVGFPTCVERLPIQDVLVTGTPVRPQFVRSDPEAARIALGLQPRRETVLIMGGSQGAVAINQLIMRSLADLRRELPETQFLHLTGAKDYEKVAATYREAKIPAVVRPFLTEMELALNAATVAVSRSGASSLAEFAAVRLPAILVPYPAATDNHQFHNARTFVESGAARMLGEERSTPENLTRMIVELMTSVAERRRLAGALANWHSPNAASVIAEAILKRIPDGLKQRGANVPSPIERRPSADGALQVREPDELAVAELKSGTSNPGFAT
jgi:UDP-N-acetylglucosamine--N-acetylmuramyl-(pentapeptide) pyrophosphoryl-undecaprenol N-acetylglucosamine transferase